MFTDSHCHVLHEYYDNIEKVLLNAKENNVVRIINASYNMQSSLEVLDSVLKYDNMYGAVGLHPENCLEEFDYDIFNKLNDKIVAIGEIGLDYHYGKENKDKQIEVFKKQLDIAQKLNLPVIIHSRDAVADTLNILKEYNLKGVIHSFSGSLEVAKEYIKMGYLLGINGVITFKNCNLKDVIKNIDTKNIILETDSPYLTPTPFRGQKNEPSHIKDIALFVSNVYGINVSDLANITNDNIKRVFDI
jgi:TatD DNase family protein